MSGALLLMAGPAPPRPRWPLLAGALLSAAVADVLLWQVVPGLSLGLAALGAAALMLLRAPAIGRRAWIVAGLLAASAMQSAIEATDENVLVLAALLLLLLGEVAYPALATPAARIAAALRSLLGAWRRWRPWWRMLRARSGGLRVLGRAFRILLPAALLVLPFALLLGLGNAVLGQWMTRSATRALHWLSGIDLGVGRFLFWVLMATLALALLRRAPAPKHGFALLGRDWPLWRRADPRMARWQGAVVLLALNALFLAANTADALHLWARQSLPQGVSFSAFVHQGTHALILATLLSGAVITAIFQQSAEVTRSPVLRVLALGWIAQNLMLLGSVVVRLWLYVEAYQLSMLRVWLALFLLVVACGFALLAWQVLRGIGLRRLVGANAAVVFGVFFAVQFCDVPGFVARTNVGLWQASFEPGKPRALDLAYLVALGPSAWPQLMTVAEESRTPEVQQQARRLLAQRARERAAHPGGDWRSVQWRTDARRRALLAAFPA